MNEVARYDDPRPLIIPPESHDLKRGAARIRTGDKGFAVLCLTTWPRRLSRFLQISHRPVASNQLRDDNHGLHLRNKTQVCIVLSGIFWSSPREPAGETRQPRETTSSRSDHQNWRSLVTLSVNPLSMTATSFGPGCIRRRSEKTTNTSLRGAWMRLNLTFVSISPATRLY